MDHCFWAQVALHVAGNGDDAEGVQQLVDLLRDALVYMPASSVNVEKLHSNTQQTATAHCAGRSEKSLQLHTYVMAARLEHRRLKKAAEDETLGVSKRRAGRLLSSRIVSRSMPGSTTTRIRDGAVRKKPKTLACPARMLHYLSWVGLLMRRKHLT